MCWVDCGPGRHDSDRLLPLKFYRISFDDVILISRKKEKSLNLKIVVGRLQAVLAMSGRLERMNL